MANAILWQLGAIGIVLGSVQGAEHSIRADGLGDFATIQAAVDAAAPGDEIVLEDGLFTGPGNRDVDFAGTDLVVRSRNGASACTIDPQGTAQAPKRAFRLTSGETSATRIEGIRFTGGFAAGPFPESGGGAILVAYGTHPVITQCVFEGNETGFQGFGAGILAWDDCDITLTDCEFRDNVSGWYGGAFVLRKFCDATVERCLVDNNYALHAGGGISITNSNPTVTDCTFTNNWVTEAGGGGALVKAFAEPVFTRCVFAGNTSWGGSGIGLGNSPTVTAIDCLFEGNVAFAGGGGGFGIGDESCSAIIDNCTFVNNIAPSLGQHFYVNSTSQAVVTRTIFQGGCNELNPAHVESGASLDIDCSLVEGGVAAISGSGTLLYGTQNQDSDPLFCGPGNCGEPVLPPSDYTLRSDSPASSSMNPCGLVGAYPVACGVTAAEENLSLRTWGALKSRYRAR